MPTIIIDDVVIDVTYKRMKSIRLRVTPPHGDVSMSAPKGISQTLIHDFVSERLDWIKQQQRIIQQRPEPPVLSYSDGEQHLFQGQRYPLRVINTDAHTHKRPFVELRDHELLLCVKPDSDQAKREKRVNDWYRQQLNALVPPLIAEYEPRMGVKVSSFGIKRMKTRWGSCNVQTHKIWVNLELAKKSPDCLEYLVVHEMAHLIEASHNHRFKAVMDQHLPNWRAIKQQLSSY